MTVRFLSYEFRASSKYGDHGMETMPGQGYLRSYSCRLAEAKSRLLSDHSDVRHRNSPILQDRETTEVLVVDR